MAPPSGFCNPRETRFAGPEMADTRQYNTYELFRWNFAALRTTKFYLFFIGILINFGGRRCENRSAHPKTETIAFTISRVRQHVDRGQRIFDGPPSI